MARRPRRVLKTFSGYENFAYLLTELELVVEEGNIEWSPPTAEAAVHRLERLTAIMQAIITQTEQENERPN